MQPQLLSLTAADATTLTYHKLVQVLIRLIYRVTSLMERLQLLAIQLDGAGELSVTGSAQGATFDLSSGTMETIVIDEPGDGDNVNMSLLGLRLLYQSIGADVTLVCLEAKFSMMPPI